MIMQAWQPDSRRARLTSWTLATVFAMASLEAVSGAMRYPDADAAAQRADVVAAQAARALEIRSMPSGMVRMAAAARTQKL
jgi:hypothetical protein